MIPAWMRCDSSVYPGHLHRTAQIRETLGPGGTSCGHDLPPGVAFGVAFLNALALQIQWE